jgi:hypothetical protein
MLVFLLIPGSSLYLPSFGLLGCNIVGFGISTLPFLTIQAKAKDSESHTGSGSRRLFGGSE